MRFRYTILTILLALALGAVPAAVAAAPPAERPMTFVTSLSGAEEVAEPPVVTRARGTAIFRVSPDGTEMTYRLIVANIENVTMAHVHLAPAGANGSVVLWLYPEGPPAQLIEGRTNGILAQGTVTEDDLVGPLAGQTLSDLVDEITEGNAYVNVHTLQVPAGEVRGQL